MSRDDDRLETITELLEELVTLYHLAYLPNIRRVLEDKDILTTDKERAVYELSDGQRTSREIAREVGIGHVTVTKYWKDWAQIGLVKESPIRRGRYKKVISLSYLEMA